MRRCSDRLAVFLSMFNEHISLLLPLFFSDPCRPACEGSEHSLQPSSLGLSAGAAPLPGLSYSLLGTVTHSSHTHTHTHTHAHTHSRLYGYSVLYARRPGGVTSWGNAACALMSHTCVYDLNRRFILVVQRYKHTEQMTSVGARERCSSVSAAH